MPMHLAFEARSRSQVELFYKAAIAAGGKDNGGPGYRDYSPGYYAAFVHDPMATTSKQSGMTQQGEVRSAPCGVRDTRSVWS